MDDADRAQVFNRYRGLLFSIAYRMLGSVTDAEDMLQETFIRWQRVERLLAIMRESGTPGRAAARIVVISGAARNGTIHYGDVNLTDNFATLRAVSQLCEANDILPSSKRGTWLKLERRRRYSLMCSRSESSGQASDGNFRSG